MTTEPTRHTHRPPASPWWLDPVSEPAPAEGCAECAGLDDLRARARERGDMSAVSDCNVLLRRHPGGHR
ncbi:hypothetical protein [Streptomyces sp. DH12]|uniref:hypothetical protein n=1 Tax=Streptomyces sp. DH12 TaxID=2857010 RepID=UPI001E3218C5|nr:hypothetical protein [Streptomyces sp. DH12]